MPDTSTTDWTDLLYEMRETLQENFPTEYVLSAELKADTSEENFSGSYVRVPQILSSLQGAGGVAEGGTVNSPHRERTSQAHIDIAELVMPISLTKRLRQRTVNNSAAQAVAEKVKLARQSLARVENEMLNGLGNALLSNVASATGSPGLVIPLTAPVNWRQFYKGRVVDIKTRSNGANPGNGLGRIIASVDKTNSTITVDTNPYDGGNSGNVTFSANEGVYIEGSYGNALQSIQQIAAQAGTFEFIDKAVVTEWQGTDGRAGDASALPLSQTMLDAAFVELGLSATGIQPGSGDYFAVGDPKAINKYAQQFYAMYRVPVDTNKLSTGFEGVDYRGYTLVPEFDHKLGAVHFVHKPSLQMYAFPGTPDFDNDTGSIWQRFSRILSAEAWLYDARQLGAKKCSTTLFLYNLVQAS
jgi:hypothetical protein